MQYTSEELSKLHENEIEILSEIARVCKENDIQWFTVGGTTLGAVRHKGFIPWDDDIDIGMLRDDYEKFLAIASQKLNNKYVLQHYSVDKNTPAYFAKVRKNNTEFREECVADLPIHHGIFVDIMPYDFIPEKGNKKEIYFINVNLFMQLYISKLLKKTTYCREKKKIFFINIVRFILHYLLMFVSRDIVFKRLDYLIRKYNNKERKYLSSRGLSVFNCKYEDIFPLKRCSFENINVFIPNNADILLANQYGDNYMDLPKESERYTHKPKVLRFE